MREEAGDERGGVAERDDDDVRREPEVRVEHGAHHLHRVAAEREMVRDDERDEADQPSRRRRRCALRQKRSSTSPSTTAPQPMKMADE